jgi:hypothetical protein
MESNLKTLDLLEFADFESFLNQKFRFIGPEDISFEVELVELSQLKHVSKKFAQSGKRQPFSLIFRGPIDPVYEQRMYSVEHSQFEQLTLFIVPVGRDEDNEGVLYQAVFS